MTVFFKYSVCFVLLILFHFLFHFDVLSSLAISIFFYWIVSLFDNANESLPIKELFLSLYGLQYLFGPALTYNGFESYTISSYRMKINSDEYFTFVIPIFLFLALGFNVFSNSCGIKPNRRAIHNWLVDHENIPYVFIFIGLFVPLLNSILPKSLAFVVYLLESLKFIGLFILILSYKRLKVLETFIIFGLITISAFSGGLFHDLLTWMIILGLILSYRFKPNWIMKILAISLFFFIAVFIQTIKGGLRAQTWESGEEVSLSLINNLAKDESESKGGVFSKENLGSQINRINQGWILASTIDNLSRNGVHTHGALLSEYLYSALLPRILAPDKLNAGSQRIFNEYSGHNTVIGTSMALGLFADAYIEFGQYGALIYVFSFGLFYGYVMNRFVIKGKDFPVLIFFILVAFIYPMRPDCETQTVLGHLIKSVMLITLIFSFFKGSLSHGKIE